MNKFFQILLISSFTSLEAQKTSHYLNKVDQAEITFDGIISEEEIKNASKDKSTSNNTDTQNSSVKVEATVTNDEEE